MGKLNKGQLFLDRGTLCEHCIMLGVEEPKIAHDAHHALLRRDKRNQALDVPENIALVNHQCHMSGDCDTPEFRRTFWTRQCNRYGAEHMELWLAGLDLVVKHFDFLEA